MASWARLWRSWKWRWSKQISENHFKCLVISMLVKFLKSHLYQDVGHFLPDQLLQNPCQPLTELPASKTYECMQLNHNPILDIFVVFLCYILIACQECETLHWGTRCEEGHSACHMLVSGRLCLFRPEKIFIIWCIFIQYFIFFHPTNNVSNNININVSPFRVSGLVHECFTLHCFSKTSYAVTFSFVEPIQSIKESNQLGYWQPFVIWQNVGAAKGTYHKNKKIML